MKLSANQLTKQVHGNTRTPVLVAVALLLGAAVGAGLVYRLTSPTPPTAPAPSPNRTVEPLLSPATGRILAALPAPVEIRFFAVLDAGTTPAYQPLVSRTEQWLSRCQQAAGAKLTVTRFLERSPKAEAAARADGLRAFNLDRGEPCYLGLVIVSEGRKEVLPLIPEWEAALEADVSRALARVAVAKSASASASEPNRAAVEKLKQTLPNLAAVSVEEGTRLLREQTLAAFTTTAKAMETQMQEAEQQYAQAATEGARQAARQRLQQVRAEQTDKLRALTIEMQELITALEQLKRP